MRLHFLDAGQHCQRHFQGQFDEQCQILVVGAGTAGAIATLAAVHMGMKTVCADRATFMGGLGTAVVMGYYKGDNLQGISLELDDIIKQESQKGYSDIKPWCEGIHSEAKKYVYEQQFMKKGGKLLLETQLVGVYEHQGKVIGARFLNGQTFINVKADIIIDATANARVSAHLGLDTHFGRRTDAKSQQYSAAMFVMNHENQLEHVYRDNGFVDTGDPVDTSNKIKRSYAELDTAGRYSSRDDNRILSICAQLGVREGTCSVGMDRFTLDMMLGFQSVNQPVFKVSSPYDFHLYDSAMEDDQVNDIFACELREMVLESPFPYGAMVVSGISGLLAIGLSADVEHNAIPPYRLKKNVMRMGETAAIAAKISITSGKPLQDCYPMLAQQLEEKGLLYKQCKTFAHKVELLNNVVDIERCIASQDKSQAGTAIYAASLYLDGDVLCDWLNSPDENKADNTAIALGLKGDKRAAARLKKMVPKNPYAVYLLGKLKGWIDTEYFRQLLDSQDYNTFLFALKRLYEKDRQFVTQYIFNDQFKREMKLDGRKFQTVIDMTQHIRNYFLKKEE